MITRWNRKLHWLPAALVLAAAAWACLGSPSTADPAPGQGIETDEAAPGQGIETDEPASIELMPEPTQIPVTDAGDCEPPAIEIMSGSAYSGEVKGAEQPPAEKVYLCVEVPPGVPLITFSLTGTTAVLNLDVGFGDLETVQNGGFLFWYTNEDTVGDRVLEVGPGTRDEVWVGPYYIEVSAEDFMESSPFTLTVTFP